MRRRICIATILAASAMALFATTAQAAPPTLSAVSTANLQGVSALLFTHLTASVPFRPGRNPADASPRCDRSPNSSCGAWGGQSLRERACASRIFRHQAGISPIATPASTSNATASAKASPIATHESAVIMAVSAGRRPAIGSKAAFRLPPLRPKKDALRPRRFPPAR